MNQLKVKNVQDVKTVVENVKKFPHQLDETKKLLFEAILIETAMGNKNTPKMAREALKLNNIGVVVN